MRTIKFRAWDIHKKCFIPVGVWALINHTDFDAFGIMISDWEDYIDGEFFYSDSQILEQFTGLHDKNGVEIYEGDVVVYPSQDCNGTPYKDTYEVIFYAPEFKLSTIKSHIWKKGAKIHLNDTVEIIGNIHQNPELL
jgi:uncharacterized phage protein (TIGR01671 family)